MKYILHLIFLIFVSSCVMDAPKETTTIVEDTKTNEFSDELKISDTVSSETNELDSLESPFILIDPDTAMIKLKIGELDYYRSELYIYLHQYYEIVSRDSIQYYSYDRETNRECGFIENFNPGISYELADCSEEGGVSETVTFPRVNNSTMKSFINKLFENEENTWTDEFSYEADGAGCYYNVTHTDTTTTINIYCGC